MECQSCSIEIILMTVYIVTGKLGNGKSLIAVSRIKEYISRRRKIATNLNINLKEMFHENAKDINLMRVPDKPNIDDLTLIGKGYEGDYDESKFGLLVLDECGTWFNARNWQDKSRKDLNDFFLHTRKLGWDILLLIQDISILDSQARDSIGEMIVTCRRLDNIRLPLIGTFFKLLTGINLTLPRVHHAKVMNGDLLSDVWIYRGTDLYRAYDTRQVYLQSYPHGTYSLLTPWHIKGRYRLPLTPDRIMRLTKIYFKRFSVPVAFATGLLISAVLMLFYNAKSIEREIILHDKVIQQQQIKPTQISSNSTSSSKSSADSGSKLSNFIASLKITGHYSVNSLTTYMFSTDNSETRFSSDDLKGMGFAVQPIADCSAKLSIDGLSEVVRCY